MMWRRVGFRSRPLQTCLEELRSQRREKEAVLRKARREQQLISKRLVRGILEGGPDGEALAEKALSQQQVAQLLQDVQHGPERLKSLTRLRQALQCREMQQTFIRIPGGMRALVGLFTCNFAEVQLEAARCLHELSQSDDHSISEACIPASSYLLTYLSGHSVAFTELCLYTLGNLAVESEGVRMKLLAQGVIPAFLLCIQSPHGEVLEALGYALSQLLQAQEAPQRIIPLVLDSGLTQHILRLVRPTEELGLGAAVEFSWCLHYLICSKVRNELLLSQDVVHTLVELLVVTAAGIAAEDTQGLELFVCPLLRCLGNLLAEHETASCKVHVQDGRLLGALFVLMQVFLQEQPFVVSECLWLLNNLTVDDPVICSAVLNWDLLPALLQLLLVCKTMILLVLTVLCNIADMGPAFCQQLIQRDVIPSLIATLHMPDPEVASQSMELLHLLFRHCAEATAEFENYLGIQALEQYQNEQELQQKIKFIIQQCIDMERKDI